MALGGGQRIAVCASGAGSEVAMIIDCDSCVMQHTAACDDCVVSALVQIGTTVDLCSEESLALDALSDAGLVAPLRLVERPADPERERTGGTERDRGIASG